MTATVIQLDGLFPAEILVGTHIRTMLPVHTTFLTKPWMNEITEKKQQQAYYDITAKYLPVLKQLDWKCRVYYDGGV